MNQRRFTADKQSTLITVARLHSPSEVGPSFWWLQAVGILWSLGTVSGYTDKLRETFRARDFRS